MSEVVVTGKPTYEELADTLFDVVNQACQQEDTEWVDDNSMPGGQRIVRSNRHLDSSFISAYADGIAMLGRLGMVNVTEDSGRWVTAEFLGEDDG